MHVFRLIWVMISLRTLLIMSLALTFPALAGEVAGGPLASGADVLEDTTQDMGPRSPEVVAGGGDVADGAADQEPAVPASQEPAVPLADAVNAAVGPEESIEVLGTTVLPGTSQRLSWSATELFEGVPVSTPVLVINGALPGPTLCLTAAVHGDELNGIEMVRRVLHAIEPQKLSGAVIGVPIVNVFAVRSQVTLSRTGFGTFFRSGFSVNVIATG